jgi:hypothetical protein
MYFLNYSENNLNYFYMSSVRNMILKQNLQIDNLFFIEIPKVQLSFFFNKETEINKINLFNNIILF